MKKINAKIAQQCPARMLAIILNIVLLLIDFPTDLFDWFFKIIEFATFLNILIISWKWRIKNELSFDLNRVNKQTLGWLPTVSTL